MISANLIREARLRAGLSQRDLAERIDRPQSSVARWEAGARRPSLETLVEVVRACDLELSFEMFAYDGSHDAFIWELLDMPPAGRLDHQVAAARGMHKLIDQTDHRESDARFDPLSVLRALENTGLRYVLVGSLAESVRGSPYLPLQRELAICPAPEDREALEQALDALAAEPPLDSVDYSRALPRDRAPYRDAERWMIAKVGATLAVVEAPPGTRGYDDLRRQASREDLGAGLSVAVASLPDLIRIADASPWSEDSGTLSALRRTLELADDYRPAGERPVVVPEGLEELFAEHGIAAA
jgi:transcriptional regulator with XRE-family HTH domain